VPFEAPKVDPRTAKEIAEQVEKLLAGDQSVGAAALAAYGPEWKDGLHNSPDPIRGALIAVFARYAELIIERLNRVPEKNFLAFLDMLGASLLPPQPARVPLTFSLASGSAAGGVVPAGTQVSAAPVGGEKAPVVFETETELVVMAAQLTSIFVRQPAADLYADDSKMIGRLLPAAVPAFSGDLPIDHMLYIGHDTAFDYPDLSRFIIKASRPTGAGRIDMVWETWDGKGWSESTAVYVRLAAEPAEREVIEASIPATPSALSPLAVAGLTKKWLRGRLKNPISSGSTGNQNRPALFSVEYAQAEKAAIKYAFANDVPVDANKSFLPFGEQPKVNDTLYLAVKDAASAPQTLSSRLTLDIAAIKIEPGNFVDEVATEKPQDKAQLAWEFWNGTQWTALNPATPARSDTAAQTPAAPTNLSTVKLTEGNPNIVVDFSQAKPCAVNGIDAYWIRVRITGGSYGEPAKYRGSDATGWRFIPPRYVLPSITSIKVSYINTRDFDLAPADQADQAERLVVLTYNDFAYEPYDFTPPQGDWPFRASTEAETALYLGFSLPKGRSRFPNRKISILVSVEEPARVSSASLARLLAPGQQPIIKWAYSSSSSSDGWSKLFVRDATESFSRSGIVEFLAPADFAAHSDFERDDTYWLRAVVQQALGQAFDPKLRGVFANTVMAAHAVTIKNEILGSSDGSKNQKYRTTHQPILTGHRLEVREPDRPSATEIAKIKRELEMMDEAEALAVIAEAGSADVIEKDGWVLWAEVPDFYGSGANDRHYIVDHLTGEIRFGDGQHGKVPPAGSANLRLPYYRVGGGTAGNRGAGTITQMKTTVPYVDGVTNPLPATGGAEGESHDQLIERAPRGVRHRGRAVAVEDYEDLARLASPDVARARCVPLYDLSRDSLPEAREREFGTVSLIIVPYANGTPAMPGMELIRRVYDYVSRRLVPVVKLVVVGPEYVRIDVETQVAVTSMDVANKVELAIAAALSSFLQPLTGGPDGRGWDFGRWPHASNFYRLIETIPGVNYVRSLKLYRVNEATGKRTEYLEDPQGGSQGAPAVDYSLVYSGTHKIELSYGD
jgi:Baseplate J-like protein